MNKILVECDHKTYISIIIVNNNDKHLHYIKGMMFLELPGSMDGGWIDEYCLAQ
jgi:hypothetical protein